MEKSGGKAVDNTEVKRKGHQSCLFKLTIFTATFQKQSHLYSKPLEATAQVYEQHFGRRGIGWSLQ